MQEADDDRRREKPACAKSVDMCDLMSDLAQDLAPFPRLSHI